jgi:hypothetical protein
VKIFKILYNNVIFIQICLRQTLYLEGSVTENGAEPVALHEGGGCGPCGVELNNIDSVPFNNLIEKMEIKPRYNKSG